MNYELARNIIELSDVLKAPSELKHAVQWLLDNQAKKEIAAKPITDPFKMASLFMAKQDTRFYLNYIYSNGTHIIASNGSTLIKIKHACAAGFYDALGTPVELDARYPYFAAARVLNATRSGNYDITQLQSEPLSKKIRAAKIGNMYFNEAYIKTAQKLGVKNVELFDRGCVRETDAFVVVIMSMEV